MVLENLFPKNRNKTNHREQPKKIRINQNRKPISIFKSRHSIKVKFRKTKFREKEYLQQEKPVHQHRDQI